MGLFSIFQGKAAANPEAADRGSDDAVLEARTRARRRLVGAGVLLLVAIIGFPLLFETQPRPIPVDIPIEIPRRDHAEPLAMPSPREPAATPSVVPAEPVAAAASAIVRDEPDRPAPTRTAEPTPAATPPAPRAKREPTAPAAAATPPARVSPDSEAARAKALLEGRSAKTPPAQATGQRYVVQVGAFADAAAAGEMRRKVEKLGLDTYTQAINTSAGQRIRVRVGPFASRDEAEKALAKTRAAGLSAVVLTL